MKANEIWNDIDVKLIAILRGIKPEETKAIVKVLLSSGFRVIEIPLNSPEPFASIKITVETAKAHSAKSCLIGAGTVLSVEDVQRVHQAGGNLIVSPNVNQEVIRATKKFDMLSAPGAYTPSECIAALNAGADILKVFPTSNMGAVGIKALAAVLPKGSQICAVGGVGNDDFDAYRKAGAIGFGLGSSLYKSGIQRDEIAKKAEAAVQAFKNCSAK